jgi:hypothetical protein
MNNIARIKERYLKDDLPRRLGGLAADLARIASSARHPAGSESVAAMLEESQYFIEWTAGDLVETDIEAAAELVDIQVMLALWRRAWADASQNPHQRSLLSLQAKKWSDQVLGYSGLLNTAS